MNTKTAIAIQHTLNQLTYNKAQRMTALKDLIDEAQAALRDIEKGYSRTHNFAGMGVEIDRLISNGGHISEFAKTLDFLLTDEPSLMTDEQRLMNDGWVQTTEGYWTKDNCCYSTARAMAAVRGATTV